MTVKHYAIHWNGGRPFAVTIDGGSVSVSKNMDTYKLVDGEYVNIQHPLKHVFTLEVDEIFVGKNSPTGGYDGIPPKQAEGNSILLKMGSKYRFIGHEIYDFIPVKGDTIVKYYSDIGNNDVPYPYAIGKTHIYIMLDKVAVKKSYFSMSEPIYEQYYYKHSIHMCLKGNPKTDLCKDKTVYGPKLKEFKEALVKLKTKQIQKRM